MEKDKDPFTHQFRMSSGQFDSQLSKTSNAFVRKLCNMINDKKFQHLISYNHAGTGFVVCGIQEFSRTVLPVHFKHNNFSSFVRQLNMYGFYKVNKCPRGVRTMAENQVWEFAHPKFSRDHPELLNEIKRRPIESENRKDMDLQARVSALESSQTELCQHLAQLSRNFAMVLNTMAEMKRQQSAQQMWIKEAISSLGEQDRFELSATVSSADSPELFLLDDLVPQSSTPSLFIEKYFDM
ncbi:uncharacterized protein VTP21DRAFT_2232 [Calcarisporiella thermophila]|uniref:uncharacterized protein n=1 Tax=Calcarisporiella thermophila TaxID=911321 RepID=UPI003742B240